MRTSPATPQCLGYTSCSSSSTGSPRAREQRIAQLSDEDEAALREDERNNSVVAWFLVPPVDELARQAHIAAVMHAIALRRLKIGQDMPHVVAPRSQLASVVPPRVRLAELAIRAMATPTNPVNIH